MGLKIQAKRPIISLKRTFLGVPFHHRPATSTYGQTKGKVKRRVHMFYKCRLTGIFPAKINVKKPNFSYNF